MMILNASQSQDRREPKRPRLQIDFLDNPTGREAGGYEILKNLQSTGPARTFSFMRITPVHSTRGQHMTNLPGPPDHLSAEAAAWWNHTVAEYDLGPHHLRLLQGACEAWDRQQQARKAIADHGGLTFTDERGVIRAHPAVAMERDARVAVARLVRELDLDGGPSGEAPRPPALGSNRG